jgi:thymidine phosphorylase
VASQSLIVASIMSKKLAESLDRLVLDVKYGRGAFMKTEAEAKKLAAAMTKVGKQMGVKIKHLLTPMDEPLGRTVGNALEVAEAVEVLQGGGPTDLIDLTLDLAGLVSTVSRKQLSSWLHDGTAWKKFVALVYAQDGDASALERITQIHSAPVIYPLPAPNSGIVKKMDAETIGRASVFLGGGRQRSDDTIDFAVGFSGIKNIGERVEAREPLMHVHARTDQALASVLPLLDKAVVVT